MWLSFLTLVFAVTFVAIVYRHFARQQRYDLPAATQDQEEERRIEESAF